MNKGAVKDSSGCETYLGQSVGDDGIRNVSSNLARDEHRFWGMSSTFLRGQCNGFGALLKPEPTIASPDSLRSCLALDHPLAEPLPDPAVSDVRGEARGCRLSSRSRNKSRYNAFSDAQGARTEEEAGERDDCSELMENSERDEKGRKRGPGALGYRGQSLPVGREL